MINNISLISSTTCNLNCSFCYLHKNQSYKEFDKLVRQAWADGSYLDNALKTVERFGPAEGVTQCQLWGGETLLHIDDVTKNLQKFYLYFPNVKIWRISTNWLIDVNKFFEFIKEMDLYAPEETEIITQLSIDGPQGGYAEQGHNVSLAAYQKNISDFTFLVNNYKLRNVKISFQINATLNKETYMEKFSSYDEIKYYVTFMQDLAKYIEARCVSKSLEMRQEIVFPGYALPCPDSAEDGKKLADIIKMWEKVRDNEFPESDKYFTFQYGIGELTGCKNMIVRNAECSELDTSLTINYNGEIAECSGAFIDNFGPYLEELKAEGDMNNYYTSLMRNKLVYNPATITDAEFEEKDWQIHSGYKKNQSTYIALAYRTALELAEANQIDYRYKYDKDLLLRHVISMLNTMSCTRENLKDTKIPYMLSIGSLRRFLNGVMDYTYNVKKAELIERRERIIFGGRRFEHE